MGGSFSGQTGNRGEPEAKTGHQSPLDNGLCMSQRNKATMVSPRNVFFKH